MLRVALTTRAIFAVLCVAELCGCASNEDKTRVPVDQGANGGQMARERNLPAPTGAKATRNECGRVRVTWDVVEGEYTYDVLRSETNEIDNAIAVCTATSQTVCLDENTTNHQDYRYWVKTRDKDGDLSEPSSRVTGRSRGPMTKPGGLSASDGLKNEVVVRWNRVEHADRYEIQERSCGNTNQPWTTLKSDVPALQYPQYVHRKSVCTEGTASEYRVRAINVCGEGPWSDVDCGWCTDH